MDTESRPRYGLHKKQIPFPQVETQFNPGAVQILHIRVKKNNQFSNVAKLTNRHKAGI
jgi:hypothetical protein